VDERATNYLHKIKTSSSRMLTLIRDVLAYSELSNVSDHYTLVNLQEIINDIQGDFELLIEQKSAKIIATDLPTVEAIPLHMSQLFGNLLSNALKFSRTDVHPQITITSSVASKEELTTLELDKYKPHYKIEVADNGIGFNPEHAAQIFNIFQRLHGKQEYEGTGIGLALCRKIVQNHHGKIYAVPEPGKGSRFVIVLPEKQQHD
jgi:signal transduction histidine kinase